MSTLLKTLSLVLCAFALESAAAGATPITANPKGGIGEIGTLYVTPPGLYARPMNNDFIGNTDKLLTGAMQTGLLRTFSNSAYTLQLNWRFLTPVYKQAFGRPDLKVPLGRFADWAEVNSGYAWRQPGSSWSHELFFGIGHVGNKGAREIHRFIHQLTSNPLDHLEYTDQRVGVTPSGGYALSRHLDVIDLGVAKLESKVMGGSHYNVTMWGSYLQANAILDLGRPLQLAGEATAVLQHLSHTYDDISPTRLEAAASVVIYRYFQSSVKVVSPYLKGDKFGQVFWEIVGINVPF